MHLKEKAKVIANLKSTQGLIDKFIHDSRKHKVASLACRKNIRESQLRINYVNEFDRLKGHLYGNRNLPAPTKTQLEARLKKLQELAKQSLYRVNSHYKDNVDDYKKDGV